MDSMARRNPRAMAHRMTERERLTIERERHPACAYCGSRECRHPWQSLKGERLA
jgi:hypothetical protein